MPGVHSPIHLENFYHKKRSARNTYALRALTDRTTYFVHHKNIHLLSSEQNAYFVKMFLFPRYCIITL